jgi:hypothetical protein
MQFGSEGAAPLVTIMPVVCLAEVPRFLRGLARGHVQRAAAGAPVLIDFNGSMQKALGMDEQHANVAVLDAAGHCVGQVSGRGQPCLDRVADLVGRLSP